MNTTKEELQNEIDEPAVLQAANNELKEKLWRSGLAFNISILIGYILYLFVVGILCDDYSFTFFAWFAVGIIAFYSSGLFMRSYVELGTINFFKYILKTKEKPPVKPLVSFKAHKMLDEYVIKLKMIGDTYNDETVKTDKNGLDMFMASLNRKDVRFVRVLGKEEHTTININNIKTVVDVQQSEVQYGHHGYSPDEIERKIQKLMQDGFVIDEIFADNDEATEIAKKMNERFLQNTTPNLKI